MRTRKVEGSVMDTKLAKLNVTGSKFLADRGPKLFAPAAQAWFSVVWANFIITQGISN